MVKLVGIDNDDFAKASVAEVLEYFEDKDYIQVDLETYGFDPHVVDIMCAQIGDRYNQFVLHPDLLPQFKKLLEEKIVVGQNLKFDLKFLYKQDIWPTKIYDTFLAESVLYCGDKLHKKGLDMIAKRRLGVDLDKSVRDGIWKEGLTTRVLQYAADDVLHLEDIMEHQMAEAYQKDLAAAIDLENKFVMFLAYIEFCGFKLDRKQWEAKMVNDQKKLEKAEEALNQMIIDMNLEEYIDTQGDLFSTEKRILINWSSSSQIVKLFQKLGINTKTVEKGVIKDSVEESVINSQKDKFPIIKNYLEFKKAEKVVTTYGQNFLNLINPNTGRIHTSYRQIMDTGRLSSGSRNKSTGEEYPNMQNIPKDEDTRGCFVAEPGNTLIVGDYSGQEQIVLANKALDPNLLEFYDNGYGDMHAFIASKMYPEIGHLSLKEIKEQHSDKRQNAKIAGFAINYGGVGKTIADQLDLTVEEGDIVYNAYFTAFPGLKAYFDEVKQEGIRNGYILISEETDRKSYIPKFERYLELKKKFTKQYWTKYREEKAKENSPYFPAMKLDVSEFFKIQGEIERKSLNYPIQGQSAEITKLSGIYFFEWLRKNKLFNIVKVVNQVHDENVVECPIEMSQETKEALTDCMIRAGQVYCKRVPLKVDPNITLKWEK